MESTAKLVVRGEVEMWAQYRDGTRVLLYRDHNLIVERALVVMAFMFGSTGAVGGDPAFTDLRPWWVALGNGGATAPASTQTNLQGTYLYSRHWDTRTLSSTLVSGLTNKVTYEFRVPEEDANSLGSPISEAGVFPFNYQGSGTLGDVPPTAPTGGLLSRIVFSPVTKQNTFVLIVNWSYTFSAA